VGRGHRTLITPAVAALALALPLSGCGEDSDESADSLSQPAPPASEFPSPEGRTLEQLAAASGLNEEMVLSPAGAVYVKGENRFGFAAFTLDREPIRDAEVAIYAAPADGGPAKGPYPARIESLATEPEFAARTTTEDPDAAEVVYVSEVEFDREGKWNLIGLVREGDSLSAVRLPGIEVGGHEKIPRPGDKAPVVHTPTVEDVGGDLSEIDTREPHDTQHEEDLADVIGEEPVVLTFATPRLCLSRVCGPMVDIAEQVKSERDDEAAFIHMEIYNDNEVDKGLRPQVRAYGLPTEPWLFIIDENGRVSTALEGVLSVDELHAELDKVTGGA
jgi:hypothetical protein